VSPIFRAFRLLTVGRPGDGTLTSKETVGPWDSTDAVFIATNAKDITVRPRPWSDTAR